MPAEVNVLIEGFTNADSANRAEDEKTACTTTLIKDGDKVIIVDPGVLDDQKIMIDALEKEGLKVDDITHIFLTHSHIDHYRNIGMFPRAKTLEYYGIWDGGRCDDWAENFTENIKIIKTPGHNYDSLTFLVTTNDGVIGVVGDVWWKEGQPDFDPYASDQEELNKSREKVLQLADYIIPGHGKMYKINK